MRLVLPLLQKCASYHLPEDCTKREEYCCVKDERLSNYFHEIFFRLLLLFFCQVWHLKESESCQTMLDVYICIWLVFLYHDDWSRMGYVGTLGKPSRGKSAVFLNIVQKAFDPPLYLNNCPILQGVFFNVF